jgi:hypothetical protein
MYDLIGLAEKQLRYHFTAVRVRLPDGYGTERTDPVFQYLSFDKGKLI